MFEMGSENSKEQGSRYAIAKIGLDFRNHLVLLELKRSQITLTAKLF